MTPEADAVLSRVRRDVEAAGGEPDWQARAEAAEAKLAAERRALHGILIRFAAEAAIGKYAHGLPEERAAFEALRRIAVDLKKAADEMAAADLAREKADRG